MILKLTLPSLVMSLLLPLIGLSQGHNNYWYFGRKAGIHFTNGSPEALTDSKLEAIEGVATISDVNGNLLFYTDGRTVYGSNHQVIQNGSGLLAGASSSQAATLFKKPGDNEIYYIITTDDHTTQNGLRYSEIQLDSNNGFGAITANKNIVLNSAQSEKVVCVLHQNYIDYWIVFYHDNSISSYLVTEDGINHTAVESPLNISNFSFDVGYLKVSPNGKYLGLVNAYKDEVQLYVFNNNTGKPDATPILLPQRNVPWIGGVYGIEFSLNSRFLYAFESTLNTAEDLDTAFIYQYDLESNDINNSKRIAGFGLGKSQYGAAQLAPDRKIYFTQSAGQNAAYLNCIEHPDSLGPSCEVTLKSVFLNGKYGSLGLPNFQNNYSLVNVNDGCFGDSTQFNFLPENAYTSLEWNFDDPASGANNTDTSSNPKHLYTAPGTYYPSLKITWKNGDIITTNQVLTIYAYPIVDLGPDTTICMTDDFEVTLNITETNVNILWQDSTTLPTFTITDTGTYWVSLNRNNCIVRDTIKISQADTPEFKLPEDTGLCIGMKLVLNYDSIGEQHLWSNGNTSPIDTLSDSGWFWLEIKNKDCSFRDSIHLSFDSIPTFDFGKDTTLCIGDTLSLNLGHVAGVYQWNTGNTTEEENINSEGLFWLEINNSNCTFRDSINVYIDSLPLFDLGTDTSLCETESLTLDLTSVGSNYLWNTGNVSAIQTIDSSGIYWVAISNAHCQIKDSIQIDFYQLPRFNLGKDSTLCLEEIFHLNVDTVSGSYLWNTGSESSDINIDSSGLYWLEIRNNGCTFRDSINIIIDPLSTFSLGPDTSICDGKSITLFGNAPLANHLWNTGDTEDNILVENGGLYWLNVILNGCTKRDSILVSEIDLPDHLLPQDTTSCKGISIHLDLNHIEGELYWSDGSSKKTFTISQPDLYTVTLDNLGCILSDTIKVLFEECEIVLKLPNVFTPNNDGNNDLFKIIEMDGIASMNTRIYGRLGNLIYETNQLEINWDGGSALEGTYYWSISGASIYGSEFEKSGHLNLFR